MLTQQELLSLPLRPLQDDTQPTDTSVEETEVEEDVAHSLHPFLSSSVSVSDPTAPSPPRIQLHRGSHVHFLSKLLAKPLPAAYVAFDGTRPWLFYWSLHALTLLAHPIDDLTRTRAVSTLLSCQNTTSGGFGGGPGQMAHLMGTYAAINALAIAGGPGPSASSEEVQLIKEHKATMSSLKKGGWDDIDRVKMYRWMLQLKQPDGSFTVHLGGEVDVRASYCVWCIATLLGIGTRELFRGMSEFLVSCQSYEGGLASTSFPTYTSTLNFQASTPRPALGEAHGGYAFCATAAYLGLRLLDDSLYSLPSPSKDQSTSSLSLDLQSSTSARLNLSTLTRWVVSLQCPFPSQGGGFKGRINKLVDGCYSWFSGAGMWGVLESLRSLEDNVEANVPRAEEDDDEVWSRAALQLYILLLAQNLSEDGQQAKSGGLRDKPGKKADAYHTCYNLAGLSAAQHIVRPCKETRDFCYTSWRRNQSPSTPSSPTSGTGTEEEGDEIEEELRRRIFSSTLGYNLAPGREKIIVGDKENELLPTHPVLNIGFLQVRQILLWSYDQYSQ